MWFVHHCLTFTGSCQPTTDGELAEWVLGAFVVFAALLVGFCALLGGLDWLDGRL